MRVYVHIGMHTTGTTSLQSALLSNADRLVGMGYRVFVNQPQMNAKRKECFDPTWIRREVATAEADGIESVIFTAESISRFNQKELDRLMNVFHGHETILIACFRHWVGFLPSRWAQNCLRRDTQSFPAYLASLRFRQETHIEARFDIVVNRMIATEADCIRIVSYDNALQNDAVLPTTLMAFDLPIAFTKRFHACPVRSNLRQDPTITELVRLFNGVYSEQNKFTPNELFESTYLDTPVSRFYDFQNKVRDFLSTESQIMSELVDAINTKNAKYSCRIKSVRCHTGKP